MSLTALQTKLLAMVCLGAGSICAGLIPALLVRHSHRQSPLILSILLCFGGGVLLSTSLVHILPEAQVSADKIFRPYIELFFIAGFFLLYLIDEIVHCIYGATANSNCGDALIEERLSYSRPSLSERRHSAMSRYGTYNLGTHTCSSNRVSNNHVIRPAFSDSALLNPPPPQLCHLAHREPCQSSVPTVNFGLLIALSMHSLLEGLVIGLEGEPTKVLLILGAVASHKLVVGFCLGLELLNNVNTSFCKYLVCIAVFSLSTVGGIGLGIIIAHIRGTIILIATPILQSLAGGTLMYVTVSEVLPRERARWHQKHFRKYVGLLQLLSVMFGFSLMTAFNKLFDT
ncbi:hypothetical protein GWI33_019048 [Rhynchophorus ferrugineus]|uniref:Zinc/iron transporter n=1 Tax=Rhynchophorus ferrugineus TaxID=354439 RepID=A0A834M5N1_RHYFE|nr:hypothetical protein GWI33_019048 [Rhynchophorus ferrugineus]